jgi:hypothetical protein
LKIFSLPTFVLKSPNRNVIWCLGNNWKPALILHKTIFGIISFLLTWCMHIQSNDIKPPTSQNYIWHPIFTNSTLLTADSILWCTKNPVPNWWLSFPFP